MFDVILAGLIIATVLLLYGVVLLFILKPPPLFDVDPSDGENKMARSWWSNLMLRLCYKFGHRGKIVTESWPDGVKPEVCTRCNTLLSTDWSRQKANKEKGTA